LPEGLPIAASGSDKGCETLGVGCRNNEYASISLGSQATIQTTTEKYYELDPFVPPFTAVRPASHNPEVILYRGFWLVSWFEKEFALQEMLEAEKLEMSPLALLNQRLQDVPIGCEGLLLQPYWGQELTRPDAKGCILGFTDAHTRIHMYRAIIEGIGFAMREGIEKIEKKSGILFRHVALSGGGSQSDAICQIAADIFNKKIYRVQTFETSGLGAAVAAFTALGHYSHVDDAVKEMVHESSVFYPQRQAVNQYEQIYRKIYLGLYGKLKPIYKEMNHLQYEQIGEGETQHI